jgi:hypothetical protein
MNRIEMTCVGCLTIILGCVACAALTRRVNMPQLCECVNNFRAIDASLEQFAIDHNGWPADVPPSQGGAKGLKRASENYRVLATYLRGPKSLLCPTDSRVPATEWSTLADTNLSYFIALGGHTNDDFIWAGCRNFVQASNTFIRLSPVDEYRWNSKAGIHQGTDFGVLLVGSNPRKTDSRELTRAIATAAKTKIINVAVP